MVPMGGLRAALFLARRGIWRLADQGLDLYRWTIGPVGKPPAKPTQVPPKLLMVMDLTALGQFPAAR